MSREEICNNILKELESVRKEIELMKERNNSILSMLTDFFEKNNS